MTPDNTNSLINTIVSNTENCNGNRRSSDINESKKKRIVDDVSSTTYQSEETSVVFKHAAQADDGDDQHTETNGQQYLWCGDQFGADEIRPFVKLLVDNDRDGYDANAGQL